MEKLLLQLIHYLTKFVGCQNKKIAANFLLVVFNDTKFFSLDESKQKIIIKNLINYFDTLIRGIEKINGVVWYNEKKPNNHITKQEIKLHIKAKIECLVNIEFSEYL